ncbi:NAD-specific glutamate dehydrogenase [Sparassis crispa]|uniref:NAD-specific glutamate dehydrogenase n=1 Tax=Sparassis crispa TaxID=139825 RepID=A0A401GLG8_9APHY|nr:NAD-specific glutamate dehydrogenase [Sparassis crispa]GBE83016.1 NAD-specific glutamate dehydrogenase [Sparassis crispa]
MTVLEPKSEPELTAAPTPLVIEDSYIAKHRELYHTGSLDPNLIDENDNGVTSIYTSSPSKTVTESPGTSCENRIDALYLDNSTPSKAYRLETYRLQGLVSATASQQLCCYFITKCNFPTSPPSLMYTDGKMDICTISDPVFLEKASENTLEIYQNVMWNVEMRYGPVIEVIEVEGSCERRLVIGYKMGSTSKFFSALSNLYHFYALYSTRKYVEQFSNGITIISLYLNPLPSVLNAPPIEHSIFQVMKEASLLYCLPDNPFFSAEPARTAGMPCRRRLMLVHHFCVSLLGDIIISESHRVWDTDCGWVFAQHFCNHLGPAYLALKNILDESNPSHAEVLNNIKHRFREETFMRESIAQVIHAHADLINLLPMLSYQHLQTQVPLSDEDLYDKIRKTVHNKHELQVLESFLIFNKHVLKTNFYQPTKVALSFHLTPDFLPEVEYPKKPFGMFFIIGGEFHGFHIRFRDVAWGGIRIVMSRNSENYSINQRMLFNENYDLASTQSLKNKDIPEGGAKGTILPLYISSSFLPFHTCRSGTDSRLSCFADWVQAQDCASRNTWTPGIKERLINLYGKPELLFFGPDGACPSPPSDHFILTMAMIEGTADMMDWAALHTRARGAETWWKSFTMGKSTETLGGIPHDQFGMMSLSIQQYVLEIYKQLGLREKDITKVQTGGPDGDLGSNEILLSSDKTIALHVPVTHFDKSKLSKDRYLVHVEDQDLKLPSGEVILDGTDFRNGAHLRFKAGLFVPCSGRPEAVNILNVAALVDSEGKPHFKYIIKGANLFLTQQARLYLEKQKVVLFKDSSTNKVGSSTLYAHHQSPHVAPSGGVTSSSLEVLAGLMLSTQEYVDLMIFKNRKPFQARVTENAVAEFQCLWREHVHAQGVKACTFISDELSIMLNDLQTELEGSDLYEDPAC